MSTTIKPIKVWGKGGPNPPKVATVLEELGVPYEVVDLPLSDVKTPEYVAINPNGRLPAIQDPNTGITLWESGAIVEYLVDRYDQEHRLSFAPGTPEFYHARQWLFYQTTGQGPYFGQAAWFKRFHHEPQPSALDRYVKEVNRVSGVLNDYLASQDTTSDGPWLVGNKLSYADISFISWQKIIGMILDKEQYNEDNFPVLKSWIDKLSARPSVTKIMKPQ